MDSTEIKVDVVRLDSDAIEDHLRTSTAFLHDIMSQDDKSVTDTSDTSEPEVREPDKEVSVDAPNICKHCGKIYKKPITLRRHILLKHNAPHIRCSQCDKTYPSQLSLEKHVRYMHRRHRCTVCYKTFDDVAGLMKHGEGCKKAAVACKVCGNVYASAVSLRNHVKYMHPAKKGYWCALCRREFVSESNLLNHRNTVHPASATVCECGRTFKSLPGLQNHVLYKHTENCAKCRHCHKAFTSEARLASHIARMHAVSVDDAVAVHYV